MSRKVNGTINLSYLEKKSGTIFLRQRELVFQQVHLIYIYIYSINSTLLINNILILLFLEISPAIYVPHTYFFLGLRMLIWSIGYVQTIDAYMILHFLILLSICTTQVHLVLLTHVNAQADPNIFIVLLSYFSGMLIMILMT